MSAITMAELSGRQREIAEVVGLKSYLKLVEAFGGDSIYIQIPGKLEKAHRNAKIRKGFRGGNYRDLARAHNLCERQVRNIIPRGLVAKARSRPLDNQISFEGM